MDLPPVPTRFLSGLLDLAHVGRLARSLNASANRLDKSYRSRVLRIRCITRAIVQAGHPASLSIPLSGSSLPGAVEEIDLEVHVAGRVLTLSFPAQARSNDNFQRLGWDRRSMVA